MSDDSERRLDPRVMQVLVHLATRAGEVVTREELSDAIWTDTYVNDNTVSQAVSRLRRALGDDTHRPRFIETISKSGYRLLVEIECSAARLAERSSAAGPPSVTDSPPTPTSPSLARVRFAPRFVAVAVTVAVAVIIGVFATRAWRARSTAPSVTVTQVVPELTLAGNQFEPTLSPQGDQIAFCWRSDPALPWSVWIQRVGADAPVRLTNHTANERLPAWSPDGRWVAYVLFPDEGGVGGIYRTAVLGGSTERLADAKPGIRSLHWSPDGNTFAMSVSTPEVEPGNPDTGPGNRKVGSGKSERGSAEPEGGSGVSNGRPWRLELLDLETGATRPLTSPPDGILGDQSPVFSPDGAHIAFERRVSPSRHDVMIVDVSTAEVSRLTNDAWGQLRGVDWSADGASVIFSSNRAGQFTLWQVPAAGGKPTALPIHDTWVTQPSVARNGGRLLYRTFRDVVDIWSLPLDETGSLAGQPVQRMSSTRSERHPAWSPTGDAIAFVSDRSGSTELWSGSTAVDSRSTGIHASSPEAASTSTDPGSGSSQLAPGSLDGAELVRHTNFSGPRPGSPSWSPDGSRLLFDAAVDGQSDLWIVARDSRNPARLTRELSEERNGTFSRDGQWIYFASDRSGTWQVWRMPSVGGSATAVTEQGGFVAHESHDGTHLYFAKLDEPGLWRMPLGGGEPEIVLADLNLSDWGSWTVGEKGIYFVRRGPTRIHFIRFDDGSEHLVCTPPLQVPYLGRSLSLSADGRSLLVTMIAHSDDEIMRVDLSGL